VLHWGFDCIVVVIFVRVVGVLNTIIVGDGGGGECCCLCGGDPAVASHHASSTVVVVAVVVLIVADCIAVLVPVVMMFVSLRPLRPESSWVTRPPSGER